MVSCILSRIVFMGVMSVCVGAQSQDSQRLFQEERALSSHAWTVEFSADGKYMVHGGMGGKSQCALWDVSTGKKVWEHSRAGTEGVNHVSLSPDGVLLAISYKYAGLIVWDLKADKQVVLPEELRSSEARNATFSPKGTHLAVALGDSSLAIWNVAQWTQSAVTESRVRHQFYFTGERDSIVFLQRNRVLLWDWQSDSSPKLLVEHSSPIHDLALCPGGTKIAWAANGRSVTVWDLVAKETLHKLKHDGVQIRSLRFSPDGGSLASAGSDKFNQKPSVRVWEVSSGAEMQTLLRKPGMVHAVCFSPDGSRLVAGGEGKGRGITTWIRSVGEAK